MAGNATRQYAKQRGHVFTYAGFLKILEGGTEVRAAARQGCRMLNPGVIIRMSCEIVNRWSPGCN